jgi:hypothetical protein
MTVPLVLLKLTTRNMTMDMIMSSIIIDLALVTNFQRRRSWINERKWRIIKKHHNKNGKKRATPLSKIVTNVGKIALSKC